MNRGRGTDRDQTRSHRGEPRSAGAAHCPQLESERMRGITLGREVGRGLLYEVESRTHLDVLLTSGRSPKDRMKARSGATARIGCRSARSTVCGIDARTRVRGSVAGRSHPTPPGASSHLTAVSGMSGVTPGCCSSPYCRTVVCRDGFGDSALMPCACDGTFGQQRDARDTMRVRS